MSAANCARCGSAMQHLHDDSGGHCLSCQADDLLGQLSAADRDRLSVMLGPGQNIQIIMEIRRLLGLELRYAVDVLDALYRSKQSKST